MSAARTVGLVNGATPSHGLKNLLRSSCSSCIFRLEADKPLPGEERELADRVVERLSGVTQLAALKAGTEKKVREALLQHMRDQDVVGRSWEMLKMALGAPDRTVRPVPFPPMLSRPQELQAMLRVLASAVPDRSGVYVSTPITTGRRFIEWYLQSGLDLGPGTQVYVSEHRRLVIEQNLAHAAEAVRRIRVSVSRVVLDPTAVELIDWQQADYHASWRPSSSGTRIRSSS